MKKTAPMIWNTNEEMNYIKRIGESRVATRLGVETVFDKLLPSGKIRWKVRQLSGYIAGAEKRVDWDIMEKVKIIAFAKAELERIK
jgi:hypothetical protein